MSKSEIITKAISEVSNLADDVSIINTGKKLLNDEEISPRQTVSMYNKLTTDEDGNRIDEPEELIDNGVRIIENAANGILDAGKFVLGLFSDD